jgi:hypothetical protein
MPTLDPSITVAVDTAASGLSNLNLLQPSAFKLVVDRKNYPNLEFFAQSVLHPQVAASPVEMPYQRVSGVPFAADKLTYGELTTMVIVDEDLNSYTEMYNWVNRMVEEKEVTATDRRTSKVPTYCDITLLILSSHNNTSRTIKYIDCIPTTVGDMALESTSGDVQYIVFPCSFRFSHFELR